MSKKNATTIFTHASKSKTRWDEAIFDAEKMICEAKERIFRLRRSIKTFEELRDSGEPFPSGKSEQTEAGA